MDGASKRRGFPEPVGLVSSLGTLPGIWHTIADADHVYDLTTMDDQLVLGIKGTLSVVATQGSQK
jgi:hypothetical protein